MCEKEEKEKVRERLSFVLNNGNPDWIYDCDLGYGYDWGYESVLLIGLYYSGRYSAKRLKKELVLGLNNQGRRNLHDLWALCGLSLVFSYIKGDKKPLYHQGTELMEFAYEHKKKLSVEFCRFTRVYVDFDNCTTEDLSSLNFSEWLYQQNRDYFGYRIDLMSAAEMIDRLYPSLKRSFFIGFVRH